MKGTLVGGIGMKSIEKKDEEENIESNKGH